MKKIGLYQRFFLIGIIVIGLLGTNNAFGALGISTAVANDPDDADAVYSVGDTITITFPAPVNASFADGTMTNTEFRANFTIATTDIDTADTVTGVWNSVPDAITFTINAIAGVDPPVVNLDTVNYDTGGNIGYGVNSTHFLGTTVTLTGDFGLFVAASTGGDGCDGDCDEPTLGVNSDGRRLVENGFTYNSPAATSGSFWRVPPSETCAVVRASTQSVLGPNARDLRQPHGERAERDGQKALGGRPQQLLLMQGIQQQTDDGRTDVGDDDRSQAVVSRQRGKHDRRGRGSQAGE